MQAWHAQQFMKTHYPSGASSTPSIPSHVHQAAASAAFGGAVTGAMAGMVSCPLLLLLVV